MARVTRSAAKATSNSSGSFSAPPRTPSRANPTLDRITDQSSKLNSILERPASAEPMLSSPTDAGADGVALQSLKGAPMTLSSESLYPSLYPSLGRIASETPREGGNNLYPNIAKTPTHYSRIPTAATGKKAAVAASAYSSAMDTDPITPVKGGRFEFPTSAAAAGFQFKFSEGLEEQGQKILEDLQISSAAYRAKMPGAEGGGGARSGVGVPPATTKKRRFSDAHNKEFSKMDSIANHYSVRRLPQQPPPSVTRRTIPVTPQEPTQSLKRTKSIANLNDREIPASPSPMKKRVMIPSSNASEDEGGNHHPVVKRFKIEQPSITLKKNSNTKIARFATGTLTPVKRRYGGAGGGAPATIWRMGGGEASSSSVANKSILKPTTTSTSSFRFSPSKPAATAQKLVSLDSPSKIPTTPAAAARFNSRSTTIQPSTVVAPKLHFPNVPTLNPSSSTPARDPRLLAPPSTVGNFTFRAKGSGKTFTRLSNMHLHALSQLPPTPRHEFALPTTPEKQTSAAGTNEEDPFATTRSTRSTRPGGGGHQWTPAEVVAAATAKKNYNNKKRKNLDDHSVNPVSSPSYSPAAKKSRLDLNIDFTTEGGSPFLKTASNLLAKGKGMLKSRLNMLATPKKVATPRKRVGTTGVVGGDGVEVGRARWH